MQWCDRRLNDYLLAFSPLLLTPSLCLSVLAAAVVVVVDTASALVVCFFVDHHYCQTHTKH